MIVYLSIVSQFRADVEAGVIDEKIHEALGHRVGESERSSWTNSLMYMRTVLDDRSIPDGAGIALELKIPQTSKRIDVIISGSDGEGIDNVIIVELKQWTSASATDRDGIVQTRLGGGLRDVPHPCYQAWSYASLLTNFNEEVYTHGVTLHPCAYLHNYGTDNTLLDERYQVYLDRAPLYGKHDLVKLRAFIAQFIKFGDKGKTILQIEAGRIRPSKQLAESVSSMLQGNEEFVMIDDQKVVFETSLHHALSASPGEKRVIIVEGGPGTGKSVVAINLLVNILSKRLFASYVTKNSAPREVYAAQLTGSMLKSEISNLFLNSGMFMNVEPDRYDALIVDEAHRLNQFSGFFGNLGENQILEIIRSARTSVFFIDEDQRVTLSDIGTKEEIRRHAQEAGAMVEELELASQFRCNGEDGYLAWVDDVLQVRETANPTLAGVVYDFRVFDSPLDMYDEVAQLNEMNGKSRVVAGYCWEWKSNSGRKSGDPRAFDIEFPEFGFRKRWNLGTDGMLWMITPSSINEIGCIHTCQGLEMDYVGVIIGPDLVVRNGQVVCRPEERDRFDKSIRGYKKRMKEDPVTTSALLDRIIKNTYRTLMTRGMKGCFVYCTDRETNVYFRTRIENEVVL